MIHRRDLKLGLALLAVFICIVAITFLMLVSGGGGELRISEKSVAVIEINGIIASPSSTVEKLERYIKTDNILAIVMRLNTPGGGVSATQEIYETVKKVRLADKKVIASMGSVAASGGYYIAAACDTIMATPGTITGSIGVIAQFADFSDLYQKIGINFNVRKSGKFKDTGSSSRKMTDEEKALIDEVVMDTYEQFVYAVSDGRKLDIDFVRKNADGRIFTGRQASEKGFVDVLGTYQDAIDLAGMSVGIGKNPPVVKETKVGFWELVMNGTAGLLPGGLERNFPSISYIMAY